MLSDNRISLDNLISLSQTGLNTATFPQIKEALIAQYKYIYGTDIDVDDTTADGVFINTNALIINNILQVLSSMYANLNIASASGKYLDILCALSNITRKPATRSNANIQVKYIGNAEVTYTPNDLTFVDKTGLEWIPLQNYTFSKDETKIVYVECKKSGPISAPEGWIYQVIDASLPIFVSQVEPANIGQEEESDFKLRVRQSTAGSGAGITTLSALESQLLSISGIQDVKIINNNSDTELIVADSTSVKPHSIYVVLRQLPGVTILDSQIGDLIYSKLTAGINTSASLSKTGVRKTYEYKASVSNFTSSILDSQLVHWKVCEGIAPAITISLGTYEYFSTAEFAKISERLMNYLNALKIGEVPTTTDLIIQCVSADPKYKGMATYHVSSVNVEDSNPLDVYNYTTYETVETESGYNLILK